MGQSSQFRNVMHLYLEVRNVAMLGVGGEVVVSGKHNAGQPSPGNLLLQPGALRRTVVEKRKMRSLRREQNAVESEFRCFVDKGRERQARLAPGSRITDRMEQSRKSIPCIVRRLQK